MKSLILCLLVLAASGTPPHGSSPVAIPPESAFIGVRKVPSLFKARWKIGNDGAALGGDDEVGRVYRTGDLDVRLSSSSSANHHWMCGRRSIMTGVLFSRGGATRVTSEVGRDDEDGRSDAAFHVNGADGPKWASEVRAYHLLWSPGAWKKIVASVVAIFTLRVLFSRSVGNMNLPRFVAAIIHPQQLSSSCDHVTMSVGGSSSTATTTKPLSGNSLAEIFRMGVLPFLSSACCALQLVLNAMVGAGGCAGFNTYLGPLRPYFVSYLLYSTTASYPAAGNSVGRWAGTAAASWFIALMPEMVHVWNHVLLRRWWRGGVSDGGDVVKATVELDIPSMGCVACIRKVDSSMRKSSAEVMEAKSWLTTEDSKSKKKGGRARVVVQSSSEGEARVVVDSVLDAVRGAGFDGCNVDAIRIEMP